MDKRLKTIAVYLPQFHEVKENSEWWGEGFTEWTAVKSAEKYFPEHNQPRVPLHKNYYDLSQKSTMIWQAELAKKFDIYGFCFYHYYFKDGKKILEKPAENLLKWKDIDLPFCFCWANETWTRTWSKINNGAPWASKFDKSGNVEKEVLLLQEYGKENEWRAHFEYLLPFFMDDRYIKKDNKPVFLIYKPDDILDLDEMICKWNEWARSAGLDGVYMIITDSYKSSEADATIIRGADAFVDRHPFGEENVIKYSHGILVRDYDSLWINGLRIKPEGNKQTYLEAFVDFDATPRHEKRGWYIEGVTPEKFEKYAYELAIKNLKWGNEFYFINAWNEWGESNYLEPDEKNGYAYLEALKRISNKCNNEFLDVDSEWKIIEENTKTVAKLRVENEKIQYIESQNSNEAIRELQLLKYRECYNLMERWLKIKESNQDFISFLLSKNIKKIFIYGFGAIGQHFYNEVKDSAIEIVGITDKKGIKQGSVDATIYDANVPYPQCDAIIITVVSGREEIVKELRSRCENDILTLWDIVNQMVKNYG
ncbi:glycosyltransferase WbsX family protein [Parablautia intestinalis]|uniref:glycosyltransferase WbsX family protein n=1 Tax=Parablautia intestinalis TaxID=2320100 RepID=UPI002412542F|nr:glycoside hydrolase family 99-like domain-containing protein [Parablautia intestinalis]